MQGTQPPIEYISGDGRLYRVTDSSVKNEISKPLKPTLTQYNFSGN